MTFKPRSLTRRTALAIVAAMASSAALPAMGGARPVISVSKDPNCGCCNGWIEHLRHNGYAVRVNEATDMPAIKARLGVPPELASCHTAEIAGYVIEGHVPADAITRLIAEKPTASGLAVPGMPIGAPGMEGGAPEIYEVVLFGKGLQRSFTRYKGDRPV